MFKTLAVHGGGSIGKRHVRLLRESFPDSKIILVSRYTKPEELLQADIILKDLDELSELRPDITFIASPASLHVENALQVSKYCSAIFIEKPISDKLNNAKNLTKTFLDNNIFCQIGYNLRYQPSLIFFREYIQKGILGTIYTIHVEAGQFLPSWRPNSDYRNTVSASKELGGGVMTELSHELDYISWIFGKPTWVNAQNGKISNLEVNVEDYSKINLGYSSEKNKSDMICSVNLDFFRQNPTRTCQVACSKGSIIWDGITGTVSVFMEETKSWNELYNNPTPRDYTYKKQIDDVYSNIINRKKASTTISDGIKVLEIIEAARVSSENLGKRIFLTAGDI